MTVAYEGDRWRTDSVGGSAQVDGLGMCRRKTV